MLMRYFFFFMGLMSSFACAMDTIDPRDLDMGTIGNWEILKTYNFGRLEDYERCIPSPRFAPSLVFTGYRAGCNPVPLNIFPVKDYTHQDFFLYENKEEESWLWLSGDRQWRVELRKIVDGTRTPSFRLQSQRRIASHERVSKEISALDSSCEKKKEKSTILANVISGIRSWCCACRNKRIHDS